MSGIWIAAVAHALVGASLVWDKVLLGRQKLPGVANYVFWLGALNGLGVFIAVLGFHWPGAGIALLAFAAGLIQLASDFFYYLALCRGEASGALAVMGGLSPAATALLAIPLLGQAIESGSVLGFALMAGGGFLMFLSERLPWRRILPAALAASAIAGLTNVLQKIVYNHSGFVSGYVFFTLGTCAGSMLLLVRSRWRAQIFRESSEAKPRNKAAYMLNRVLSGVGSLLVFFAISRANPAIVDAISGLRYAVVFAGAYLLSRWRPQWLHEEFTGKTLTAKVVATSAVIAGLVLAGIAGAPRR